MRFIQSVRSLDKIYLLLFSTHVFLAVGLASYEIYVNLFFNSKGISSGTVGFLATILPVSALVFAPFWAKLGDKTQNQKGLTIVLAIGGAISGLLYLLGQNVFHFALLTALYAVFGSCIYTMLNVTTMRICQERGFQFSVFKIGGTLGYAFSALILRTVIPQNLAGAFIVLGVFFAFSALSLAPIPWVKQKPVAKEEGAEVPSIFANKLIIFALLLLLSLYIGASFYNAFLGILLKEKGMDDSLLGICFFVSCMSEVPILLMANRLIKRFGELRLMAFAGLVMTLRLFLVPTGGVWLILAMQAIQGPSFMLSLYSGMIFIYRIVHPSMQTRGLGLINVVQVGVGSILGNLIGGQIAQRIGLPNAYYAVGVVSFSLTVVAVIGLLIYQQKKGVTQTLGETAGENFSQ